MIENVQHFDWVQSESNQIESNASDETEIQLQLLSHQPLTMFELNSSFECLRVSASLVRIAKSKTSKMKIATNQTKATNEKKLTKANNKIKKSNKQKVIIYRRSITRQMKPIKL